MSVYRYILKCVQFAQFIGDKREESKKFLDERTFGYVSSKISEDDEVIGVNKQAKGQATKGVW